RVLQRNDLKPQDRGGVPTQCRLHGAFGRHEASLYDDRGVRARTRRRDCGVVLQVPLIVAGVGLLGRKDFAVDWGRLSSNASKQWSGTHEELRERQAKLKKLAKELVKRHRERDTREAAESTQPCEATAKQLSKLRKKIKKINDFLATEKKRIGPSGKE